MRHRLHNQFPTHAMSDADYEAAVAELTVQISSVATGFPDGEARKAASDALAQTFGAYEEQTALDWIKSACFRIGVDHNHCAGL